VVAAALLAIAFATPALADEGWVIERFAADITIAVFVTITVEVSVQVTETLHI